MRRIVFLGILIILLIWGIISCMSYVGSSLGNINTPESTTKAVIMSMESMKPDKTVAYFTPIPGALMRTRLGTMHTNISKLDIQNLRTMVMSNEGSAARVQAVYDVVFTTNLGEVGTQHYAKTIKLINQDDKWLVNEVF